MTLCHDVQVLDFKGMCCYKINSYILHKTGSTLVFGCIVNGSDAKAAF